MNYMTKESIMNRLQEHYDYADKKGKGEILAIFLQGSQNYIDDKFSKESDVDSRAVYLPTMRDICLENDISQRVAILDNGEHIDRQDIRKFMKIIKTPGVNSYENLFTEYLIVNPKYQNELNELLSIREEIAYSNQKRFLMSLMGVSKRSYDDLLKEKGSQIDDIKKLGYSRKQLANIIRFNKTAKAYVENKPFSECLKSMDQDLIYNIRRTNYYTLDEALKIANEVDQETKRIAHEFPSKNQANFRETTIKLEDVIVKLMIKGADNE